MVHAKTFGMVAALALAACGGGGGGDGGGGTPRTIGTDSSVAPLSGMRCVDGFPAQDGVTQFPALNAFMVFGGTAGSCTVLTFSQEDPGTGGPGTVTQASVRVGATTGRMRFVQMRNLYQNQPGGANGSQCCAVIAYGPVFTPTPNAVTTVPLNFRMAWEPVPPPLDMSTIIGQDRIALEVLDPGTPIPGTWMRNGLPQVGVNATFIWLPSVSAQGFAAGALQMPNRSGSFSGWIPTFNYTFVPG